MGAGMKPRFFLGIWAALLVSIPAGAADQLTALPRTQPVFFHFLCD